MNVDNMKKIDKQLLDEVTGRAKLSPRLRMNYNFHQKEEDAINRLLNAMEPDTYIRPHRHHHPPKEEIFFLLRGRAVLFLFDDEGNITETMLLDPLKGSYGAEIAPGVWHSLLVLDSGTVVYEIKEGPYIPLIPEDMALWSPSVEEVEEARRYMDSLKRQIPK